MTKIIELAHELGEEIGKSDEMTALKLAKDAYDNDEALQEKVREYEAERLLLGQEFSKEANEVDEIAVANLKARIDELAREITSSPNYIVFMNAQKAVNEIMTNVNDEIKFCITGERPEKCTHDCSTCGGCSH